MKVSALTRSIRRAVSRVSVPKLVVSDNHKSFRARPFQNFVSNFGITWKFILQRSPHWGGFYEVMNRLVKKALLKAVKGQLLTYEELETVLIEIEGVINCRPLVYADQDHEFKSLTPSHLMYGRRLLDPSKLASDNVSPKLRCDLVQKAVNSFWLRFKREYLTELREHHQRKCSASEPLIREGDVVLIREKFTARSEWKMGLVVRVIRSSENVPKGAALRLSSGQLLNRPLNLLCPTEIRSFDDAPVVDVRADSVDVPRVPDATSDMPTVPDVPDLSADSDSTPDSTADTPVRARRAAAVNADAKRRVITDG